MKHSLTTLKAPSAVLGGGLLGYRKTHSSSSRSSLLAMYANNPEQTIMFYSRGQSLHEGKSKMAENGGKLYGEHGIDLGL